MTGSHPYSTHTSSGVPWLCNVPAHWEVRRLGTVADMRVSNVDKHSKEDELPVRLCNYVDVYKNDHISRDMPFMKATASTEEIDRFRLRKHDVLITKDSEAWNDIGVPALVTEPADDLISGYHLALLRPKRNILGPFLFRTLQSKGVAYQFNVAANGVTRYGLTHSGIQSVMLPLPPPHEQAAIVRYLDDADQRIRAYVSAKARLIALLEEERQAVIHQAVTRGLDPNVRLKPSGVEWLGDVPEHWVLRRLKQVSGIQTGLTLGKEYGNAELVERPYLRVANVQSGHLNLSQITTVRVPHSEVKRTSLKIGDVLMTEGGDIDKLGRGCVWQGEVPGCLHQNHIFAVRPNPMDLNPMLLVALMGTPHGRHYFQSTAKRTTNLASTNQTTLGEFPMYLPDISEQQAIVDHVASEGSERDTTIELARRQIELMEEYRTRLIAGVVTGKIDVQTQRMSLSRQG